MGKTNLIRKKNSHISQKIIFYVYLVISPILIGITTFILVNSYRDTSNKQIEAESNVVKSLDKSISMIQTELSDLSLYICINDDINAILSSSAADGADKDSRLWYNMAPMKIIEDMVALKGYIKTMAIYPENGVKPYLRCLDSSVQLSDIEAVRKTETYRQAVKNKGDIIWEEVKKGQNGIFRANYTDKIVMYREMFNLSKEKRRGYLVLGINRDKYTDLCKNSVQQENEGIVILSSNGNELARYGMVDETILSYIKSREYLSIDYRKRDTCLNKGAYYVYCSQQQRKGALVIKMVPKANTDKQLYNIIIVPILLLIGMLIGLWPLLKLISNVISAPLQKLCIAMEDFRKGDFDKQVEVSSNDEIGEVTACFNQMVLSIKQLIDNNYVMALKEKESELIALQAQINPHFLYNTLDSLYWRTQNDGNDELAEDILALSQLFRLVLGQGKGIIPVRMEKELISNYLHIQKMRFGRRLVYTLDMDEDIMDAYIPKLILQPFVENAIVHGFENEEAGGILYIGGEGKGTDLLFTIKDNGIGMVREQIDSIFKTEDLKQYAGQRISRYAIKNVKERLTLKYQDRFNLKIESKPGEGTVVTIRIPWEGQKGEYNGGQLDGSR